MDCDLENPQEYCSMLVHKLGGDFIPVAKQLLTDEIRSAIVKLLTLEFPRHEQYNLPERRLEVLNACLQKQIRDCLT
jgi:hypothetical protein